MKKKTRQILILNGLLILIVATAILSVNSGYARIPFSTCLLYTSDAADEL